MGRVANNATGGGAAVGNEEEEAQTQLPDALRGAATKPSKPKQKAKLTQQSTTRNAKKAHSVTARVARTRIAGLKSPGSGAKNAKEEPQKASVLMSSVGEGEKSGVVRHLVGSVVPPQLTCNVHGWPCRLVRISTAVATVLRHICNQQRESGGS